MLNRKICEICYSKVYAHKNRTKLNGEDVFDMYWDVGLVFCPHTAQSVYVEQLPPVSCEYVVEQSVHA